eukprot:2624641-Amphidinium_carterae.1
MMLLRSQQPSIYHNAWGQSGSPMWMDATSEVRQTCMRRSRPRTGPGESSPTGLRISATLHAREEDIATSERVRKPVQNVVRAQDGPLHKS